MAGHGGRELGSGGGSVASAAAFGCVPNPDAAPPDHVGKVGDVLPLPFQEILDALGRFEHELGGVRHFKGRPMIERKVKASDFRNAYTDFEYVYLTILGFARLHSLSEELASMNNGRKYKQNPCVQMLESQTGMTMHADREGANHVLRSAAGTMLQAFEVAKRDAVGVEGFFREAFDRTADPCLEGRAGRLLEYLQSRSQVPGAVRGRPPPGDLAVELPGAGAEPEAVVGEYLRVFVNDCTWRYALREGLDYDRAKLERDRDGAESFAELCNAATFEVMLLARGCIFDKPPKQWEVQLENGTWSPYGVDVNQELERARLVRESLCQVVVRNWTYEVNLKHMVQMNLKTKKERPLRCIQPSDASEGDDSGRGKLLYIAIKAAINHFVDLQTVAPRSAAPAGIRSALAAIGQEPDLAEQPLQGATLHTAAVQLPGTTNGSPRSCDAEIS